MGLTIYDLMIDLIFGV